jgi:hypothetical protein
MDMANLPVLTDSETEIDRFSDAIGAQMARGLMPMDIARKLYPDDHKKRLAAYMRIRRRALSDERVVRRIQEEVKLTFMAGLGPASRALVARAARGRPDAIKILYEASGFHNPRVQHQHSGEIKIRLEVPRPAFGQDDEVVDADVVD